MFETTRYSRPMLKNGRLLTVALLALSSFGAPALSAQTCCFVPNFRTPGFQQPRANARYLFNIAGVIYRVDDSLFVWGQNPAGPVGHIVATGNGYIANMYSGRRYWAYPVQ
jgi:hypothetical protein